MENIFVVIFLLGFISFLFQKLKGNPGGGAPRRNAAPMPPFGQGPAWGELRKALTEVQQQMQQSGQAPATPKPVPAIETPVPELAELPKAPEAPVWEARGLSTAPPQPKPRERQPQSAASPFAGNSRSSAMQGMMWAEVFGPPRSKKPHTSRR